MAAASEIVEELKPHVVSLSSMHPEVRRCVDNFRQGKPVMVYDSDFRESETDLLFPAIGATPEQMRTLRNDCGGLLFLAGRALSGVGEAIRACGCEQRLFTLCPA